MGTLGGHLLPGSFFIIFGVWWGFVTAIRFHQAKGRTGQKKGKKNGYHTSVTMPCFCLPCKPLKRAPIESILKFVLAGIALFLEAYTGYYHYEDHIPNRNYVPPSTTLAPTPTTPMQMPAAENHEHGGHEHGGHDHAAPSQPKYQDSAAYTVVEKWSIIHGNQQHITMYSGFMIGSLIEMMIHYGYDMPERLDYVTGALAFFIEGFLFNSHLHGKEPIEQYVHVLLVYAIIGCFLFGMLEFFDPKQVLYTYGRTMFTILQGTWFFHVGFMLYPPSDFFPKWDLSDHENIMLVSVAFCWHMMLVFLGLLVQAWLVKIWMRNSQGKSSILEDLFYIDQDTFGEGMPKPHEYKLNGHANSVMGENGETRFLTVNSDDDDEENDLNERVLFTKK